MHSSIFVKSSCRHDACINNVGLFALFFQRKERLFKQRFIARQLHQLHVTDRIDKRYVQLCSGDRGRQSLLLRCKINTIPVDNKIVIFIRTSNIVILLVTRDQDFLKRRYNVAFCLERFYFICIQQNKFYAITTENNLECVC